MLSKENRIRSRVIESDSSVRVALKQMDAVGCKLLIVLQKGKFHGLLSIGDIQRAIINNLPLETAITSILRKEIRYVNSFYNMEEVKKNMFHRRTELMPVVDEDILVDVIFWEDLFEGKEMLPVARFNLPVVIMAGGFGKRLRPLTNVIPKPLIPINEKTIIENIFQRFSDYGCNEFYISVNYKADLIKYYLDSLKLNYKLTYFKETKPLGTAGSLFLIKDQIKSTFFINNCDILIEQDYSEVLKYHKENGNLITVVAAIKNFPIPYGIIDTGLNGSLISMQEKPELTFKINSGMYILEHEVLSLIPDDKFYHITQLIEDLQKKGGKVGVFPVSEKSWKDIGDWPEYISNISKD